VKDLRAEQLKKQIGERLKELRKKAGVSPLFIEQQSEKDGKKIDRTYIYDIEKGNANWSIDHLARILAYCHSSLESFFMGFQRSDVPLDHQPFHRMLMEILSSGDPDLVFGIRVNLEAISEKAARVKAPRQEHPPPTDNRKRRRA
jgi:transcriptional regulator with XRE-family HTH domain